MATRNCTPAVFLLAAALLATPMQAVAQRTTPPPLSHPWGSYIGAAVGEPEFGELGLKVFGGQQFHPNLAWEATYVNFLEEKIAIDNTTEFWGLSGTVVGILPLQQGFSLFGKVGLMYGRERVRRGDVSRTDDEFNPLLGIGGHYQLTPRVGLRLEYEDFGQGSLLSAGAMYRF